MCGSERKLVFSFHCVCHLGWTQNTVLWQAFLPTETSCCIVVIVTIIIIETGEDPSNWTSRSLFLLVWLASKFLKIPVPMLPVLELQACTTTFCFYRVSGELNTGHFACSANTLLTEPSPQLLFPHTYPSPSNPCEPPFQQCSAYYLRFLPHFYRLINKLHDFGRIIQHPWISMFL